MDESDPKKTIDDDSDGGMGGQEEEEKQEEQAVDEQETEEMRTPSAAGQQQGRRDKRQRHHSRATSSKQAGRYGEDDDESVAAIPHSSRNLNSNTTKKDRATIVESLPSTTPVQARGGVQDTPDHQKHTIQQGQSTSAGAYAVRGEQAVRRDPGAGENVSLVSSSEMRIPPPVPGSSTRRLQQQRSQPIVVEAELAHPNEEVLQARMEAQRLREQLNALEARVDEMQPTAQAAVANAGIQLSSQPILVRAEPMDDPEEAPVDERSAEGLRRSPQVMDDRSLSKPSEGEEEEDFDILPSSGDITPPLSSSEDVASKKKRVRLMVLGAALLLVIVVVAVAVPLANQSSSSSSAGVKATVGVPTSAPTLTPTQFPTRPPTRVPTPMPTRLPTRSPTRFPTRSPTRDPTRFPTRRPTRFPTRFPTSSPNAPSSNNQWAQLGQNLNGRSAEDFFGFSISLSRDATVMAVGADQFNSTNPGYVSVFQFNAQTQLWTPMGQELVGEANGDHFGWSVSLNGDGTILAVGAVVNDGGGTNSGHVRVYEYDTTNSRWLRLGRDIDGEAAFDEIGSSVSLSDQGDVLAVGAAVDNTSNGVDSGSVRFFRYSRSSTSWTQMGQTLMGQAANDRFGRSVSLSSSGTVVAVGAYQNDVGGTDAGQVSVFQFNVASSTWVPMGAPINGQVGGGSFGWSVALDDGGQVLAVGAPSSFNRALVFEFDGTMSAWRQRGQILVGDSTMDAFGHSVSLSDDGNVVAVGVSQANAPGLDSGQVRIYQYDTSAKRWNQVGEDLNGETIFDEFGHFVSLSGNGTVVGAGAWKGNLNGMPNSGYAKVFTLN